MTKLIYLSGPIEGLDYEGATDWRAYVAGRLDLDLTAVSPMRGKEVFRGLGSITSKLCEEMRNGSDILNIDPRSITCRDYFDVQRADAIFLNMTQAKPSSPSVGSSIEIGWAHANRVPIIMVCPKTEELAWYWKHPIVAGAVGWHVEDLDTGIAVVNGLFVEGT